MKKIIISLGFVLALTLGANAQVKIKDGTVTSSTTPNSNAILELESNNKGLIYPRVALTSTSSASPLSAHVQGMTVYNTATAGTGTATAVTPGIYYNDGTQWIRATDWLVFGSSTAARNGTPAGNTDSQYVMGRVAVGQNSAATVASTSSGSTAAQQKAEFTVTGGDASINGLTVGKGGGQGSDNTVLGYQALYNNLISGTGGGSNTVVGYQAMYNASNNNSAQNNNSNTAIGYQALYSNNGTNGGGPGNISGGYNTALGMWTLRYNTTGSYNTAVGAGAGQNVTTGKYNILLGSSNWFSSNNMTGHSITTESNNIVIGSLQDIMTTGVDNQLNIGGAILGTNMSGNQGSPKGNIGIAVAPNASYALNVGGNTNVNGNITATGTITPSDRRIKTDVETFTDGLNVIAKLKPVTFHYNEKSGYSSAEQQKKHVGFIAQDVEKVAPYMVTTIDDSKGASGLSDKREIDMGALNQILVNAVQEQQKEIEQLKKEIEALKK